MSAQPADVYSEGFARGWQPDTLLTVSQWADAERILSQKASSEHGHWRTSRTPYLREIMDSLGARHPARRVVFMKGTQIGATEAGNNWIGYIVCQSPGPTLMVMPTVEVRDKISKQRLAPMIEETPALAAKIAPRRSRDSGNTLDIKEFEGGVLLLAGANSAAGLRSMPIRNLFCDEIDEYPADVDDQGDPVRLAEKRLANFARRKAYLVSSPTVKGFSRIEREFGASDQRYYHVPCPECGDLDYLRWDRIRYVDNDPSTVRLACFNCGALIDERHKTWMMAEENGARWIATAESRDGTLGYHLSALYSPLGWLSWAECVHQWLEAQGRPELLQIFINTVLGETYEERGDSVEPNALMKRAEAYPAEVPTGVGILLASVDVQGDRLEVQVTGYGHAEESWLIAYAQLPGDPGEEQVWLDVSEYLSQTFTHESGREVGIHAATFDSGGHHTDEVYKFCKAHRARRFYAIRGGNQTGKPLVGTSSNKNKWRCRVWTLCVDSGKDTVFSRLRTAAPGPGYVHFPDWADEEYYAGLTAEKMIRRYKRGHGMVRVWVKTRERNEPLDLTVYALACLFILPDSVRKSLAQRAAELARPIDDEPPPDDSTPPIATRQPRRPLSGGGGWVSGWK